MPKSTTSLDAENNADILRFVGRCQHEMETFASVHETAIGKVKSVVSLLWPRAQVKAFGSFATGLMRPGSDIDLGDGKVDEIDQLKDEV